MAARRRSRRNRMPAGLRRYWAKHRRNPGRWHRRHVMRNRKHHRRTRRNYTGTGMVAMNPRRRHRRNRRHFMKNRRRHHARRNPQLLGISLPPVMDIAGIGSGLILTPMIANYIFNNFVASTSFGTSKWAYIGTEAATVAGAGWAARKFVGVQFGNMVILGGAVKVVMDIVNAMAPTLLPSLAVPANLSGVGFYETMPRRRTLSGVGSQPFLGAYITRGRPMPQSGRAIQSVPDRLDPGGRF